MKVKVTGKNINVLKAICYSGATLGFWAAAYLLHTGGELRGMQKVVEAVYGKTGKEVDRNAE